MNATSLSFCKPSRAARIIRAWNAWRTGIGGAIDGAMFVCLLLTWCFGYALLCPTEPVHHHGTHVAQVQR